MNWTRPKQIATIQNHFGTKEGQGMRLEVNLINKRHGSRMLKLTASRPNHASYRKVYFTEFVKKYWGCDMGMIIFDLHGGC